MAALQRTACQARASATHLCSSSSLAVPLRPIRETCHPSTSAVCFTRSRWARSKGGQICRASQNDIVEPATEPEPAPERPREDDALPEDLADAIDQAAQATAVSIKSGSTRTQVELLLPEFWDPISGPIFPNRGDQDRFWRITRRFVELLASYSEVQPSAVNAVYPDAGVAAMLAHQWSAAVEPDAPSVAFRLTSLNDRRPVKAEDELVVLACPDPPGADDAIRVVRQVAQMDEEAGGLSRPIVIFNQRLSSGDVGLGLNARRMRTNFLNAFSVTYSLRPIGEVGTVYRRYPGVWQVFLQDPEMPGRYKMIAEKPSRPQGEYLDFLVQEALGLTDKAEGVSGGAQGLAATLARTMSSMQRFMKSLAN